MKINNEYSLNAIKSYKNNKKSRPKLPSDNRMTEREMRFTEFLQSYASFVNACPFLNDCPEKQKGSMKACLKCFKMKKFFPGDGYNGGRENLGRIFVIQKEKER